MALCGGFLVLICHVFRFEQFVELTQTDEMMAQFYLQDRDWSVERSVQAFFDEKTSAANVDRGDSRSAPVYELYFVRLC